MGTLAETADEMEAAARRLHEDGKFEAASELWKAAADLRAALRGLQSPLTRDALASRLPREMEAAHRQKLADARTDTKLHPNLVAARAAGLATMADLAAALGYSKAMLSRIMSKDRAMPAEKAALFKKLTGKDWR